MADNQESQTNSLFRRRAIANRFADDDSAKVVEKLLAQFENTKKSLQFGTEKTDAQVRKDNEMIKKLLITGAIDAGDKQGEMVSLYNRMLENSTKGVAVTQKVANSVKDSLANNMPSVDSLISAVTVANPMTGFALRFLKDISADRKRNKEKDKEYKREQLDSITFTNDVVEKQEKVIERQDKTNRGTAGVFLKIHDELMVHTGYFKRLYSGDNNFTEQDQSDVIEVITESDNETQDELVRISDTTGKLVKFEEIAAANDRADDFKDIETKLEDKDIIKPEEKEKKKDQGMFGNMLGGLKNLIPVGLLGGLAGALGSPLLLGVAALAGATKLFIDGFNNAADILDKDAKDLTLTDKVAAGIGNVVGIVGTLIDGMFSLIGIETNYGDKITKWVAKGLANVFEKMQGFITDALMFADDAGVFESISKAFEFLKFGPVGIFAKGVDWLGEQVGVDVGASAALGGAASWIADKTSDLFFGEDVAPVNGDINKPSSRLESVTEEQKRIDAKERSELRSSGSTVIAPSNSITNNSYHQQSLSSKNRESVFNRMNTNTQLGFIN